MLVHGSLPQDRQTINRLLEKTLGIPENAVALHREFQHWKYWGPHPWLAESRSRVLEADGEIAAHVCLWPIRIATLEQTGEAFHPIDWGAKREVPGAGLNVLRSSYTGYDAAFSVGGSEMTQKILPAFGFKRQNSVMLLQRPLHPWNPAWKESPRDWKLLARVARNWRQHPLRSLALPHGWNFSSCDPQSLSSELWPKPAVETEAVSVRSPELLAHFQRCPELSKTELYVLKKGNLEVAYFFLAQVRDQVRVADYGPANLDGESGYALGVAVQMAARTAFPAATSLFALTSDVEVAAGWQRSGLYQFHEEPIKVLKLNKRLSTVTRFRLTMLDWDALCL